MKDFWLDPVILVTAAGIAIGFILLILAIRALRRSSASPTAGSFADAMEFPIAKRNEPLSVVSPESNPFSAKAVTPPPPSTGQKDVIDKVDLISQRLVDMQMLLNKQLSAPQQGGGGALGFSAETLDKLLKITASVVQQVDALQKTMGTAASDQAGSVLPPPTPSAKPGNPLGSA